MPGKADGAPARTYRAHAFTRFWRILTGGLFGISRASLLVILWLVLRATDPPVTPPVLVRLVLALAVAPGLAAALLRRAFTVTVAIRDGQLDAHGRGLQIAAPCRAVADVVPWVVPLPAAGFSLRFVSGERLRWGLAADDPTPLLGGLSSVGVAAAETAAAHPSSVYAHARATVGVRRWYHLLGRFVGFALVPTAVLFNAHQHIAYGGPLGQYYMFGLAPYLRTFAVYWLTLALYLLLYASLWRALAEGVCLAAAWLAPARAAPVRRAAEVACQVLYYGGVPLLLLVRFLD